MGAEEDRQRRRLSAVPLLLFAAVDLVLALVLLMSDGLSGAFFAIAAIGTFLAAIGFVRLYRRRP
ncbi:MAG: hypothetical protein H0V45_12700 [Actinobacteria bacterium]|nr:hypothetical protein [Actinomycetota bacterium]